MGPLISENRAKVQERGHSWVDRIRLPSRQRSRIRDAGQSGQIIVEYVLLLAIAVIVAALITRMMISPSPDSPGFILKTWDEIVKAIGADHADDITR